jgi:hypothetical protein
MVLVRLSVFAHSFLFRLHYGEKTSSIRGGVECVSRKVLVLVDVLEIQCFGRQV